MTETQPAPGHIRVEPVKNIFRDRYRFVAEDADGNVILEGDEFTSAMFRMSERKQERAMLNNLVEELAAIGWRSVPTGGKWYAHRLYHVGTQHIAPTRVAPREREGLSPTLMWGWTIAIVILLFVICVVLVYTSEVQFTAG